MKSFLKIIGALGVIAVVEFLVYFFSLSLGFGCTDQRQGFFCQFGDIILLLVAIGTPILILALVFGSRRKDKKDTKNSLPLIGVIGFIMLFLIIAYLLYVLR